VEEGNRDENVTAKIEVSMKMKLSTNVGVSGSSSLSRSRSSSPLNRPIVASIIYCTGLAMIRVEKAEPILMVRSECESSSKYRYQLNDWERTSFCCELIHFL
jgi:hypothetical protein